MDKAKACQLWAQLCAETVGVDHNGDAVERITHFGTVATAANLSLYIAGKETPGQVAAWLEGWAKAIRGEAAP